MLETVYNWLNQWPADSTATLLIEASIKATALLAAAALVALAMSKRRAAERHALWSFALTAAVVLPLLGALLPHWSLPHPVQTAPSPLEAETNPDGAFAGEYQQPASREALVQPFASLPGGSIQRPVRKEGSDVPLLIWALGIMIVAIRYGHGSVRFLRRSSAGELMELTSLPARVRNQLTKAGIAERVRFVRAASEVMPMTWGYLRPVVLVPAGFDSWSRERREVVLLHELGHVLRRDALTQAIGQAACAVFWFHPFVWLAAVRMRFEAEQATDDYVLQSGALPSDYAEHLVDVARQMRASGAWGAMAMARPSSLGRRVRRLLEGGRRHVRPGRLATSLALVTLAAVALPLAALRMNAQEQPPIPDPPTPPAAPAAPEVSAPPEPPAIEAAVPTPPAPIKPPVVVPAPRRLAQVRPAPVPRPPQPPAPPERSFKVRTNSRKDEPALPDATVEAVVEALTTALRSSDTRVRKEAAEALGRIGRPEPATLQALVDTIDDGDPGVQREALGALGRLLRNADVDTSAAAGAMVRLLRHEDAGVRKEAAEALGRIGTTDLAVIEALSATLSDEHKAVRGEAMEALGRIANSETVEPDDAVGILGRGLESSYPGVRREAVEALGRLRRAREQAIPLLIGATKDSDPEVQREAVEALGRLTSRNGGHDWQFDWEGHFKNTFEVHLGEDRWREYFEGNI